MTTYREMELIQRGIEEGDSSLVDDAIVDNFIGWLPSYNCITAAEGYFSFLSSIAKYKPNLIEPLLKKAIEPVYFLGYDNAEGVLSWAIQLANNPNAHYKSSNLGKFWLLQELPIYKDFIEKCLSEYMDE
ncbi:hypothetical protein [Paenibacillus sp. UNC451MF]|uniref:hypothetical protein n=1 Tax=Paenibacillus sp. UNC451MF TaxID=1449063 RepID=UPI00048F17DF|nr:hypothetical protein [Paenibacillus sp. UNC451MF]